MIKETLTVEQTIEFLNELVALDPKAIEALIAQRVPCNDKLLKHPSVQVTDYSGWDNTPRLGILGLLNGLFGTYDDDPKKGWGPIAAFWEGDGSFKEFLLTRDLVDALTDKE